MAEGHRERVRNRLLSESSATVPPYVFLESYLHGVVARKDTHAIANRLIDEFGSFANVVDAPIEALMEVEGVGEIIAKRIKLLPVYMRGYIASKFEDVEHLPDSDALGAYLQQFFFGIMHECAYALCLNNVGRRLGGGFLSDGTMDTVQVYTRQIITLANKFNATGVVLAHKHPHGISVPSQQDLTITRILKDRLSGFELTLVDHLIMEDADFVSMRDSLGCDIWPEGRYQVTIGAK